MRFHIESAASAVSQARPVLGQKAEIVENDGPKSAAANIPCRSCGTSGQTRVARDVKTAGATFQVIVACATCGHAFAALSRN
jgi:DnaJ-class molecular chaperone